MKFTIKNKNVLITGGADGIGKALVHSFIKNGANVIFCDINDINSKKLVKELSQTNRITYYNCDVANPSSVKKMLENIKTKFGELHILINNAAKQTIAKWDDMTEEEFSDVVDVNLKGVYYCMKNATKIMNDGSTIVNILSVYYYKPRLNKFHYDAAKAGVSELTKESALALGEKGISVNAIYPGYAITPMNEGCDHIKALDKNILKNPELIKSETFAESVIAFIENFALITTGQLFGADAGRGLK